VWLKKANLAFAVTSSMEFGCFASGSGLGPGPGPSWEAQQGRLLQVLLPPVLPYHLGNNRDIRLDVYRLCVVVT
jgi:hypothetical protein